MISLLTVSSSSVPYSFISVLGPEFDMKDLRPLHHFPGLSVIRCQYGLFLSHLQYATDILHHAIRQRATHVAGLLTPRESYVPPLAPLFSILHSITVLLVHSYLYSPRYFLCSTADMSLYA